MVQGTCYSWYQLLQKQSCNARLGQCVIYTILSSANLKVLNVCHMSNYDIRVIF